MNRPITLLARSVAATLLLASFHPAAGQDAVSSPEEVGRLEGHRHRFIENAETARLGEQVLDDAIAWLRTRQNAETGAWDLSLGGDRAPELPAITGLVLDGLLLDPDIEARDEDVAAGLRYLLARQQDDGGIYANILPNYNTAIAVSALSKAGTAPAEAAIPAAVAFLERLQWAGQTDPHGRVVDPAHPWYGGAGYGNSSRPDNSNLHFLVQALHDAGVDPRSESYRRALVFLQRTQMLDSVNDMPYADDSDQGGFIYATSPSGDEIGVGESKAGMIEETLDDGTEVSRLRAYGSMTYAGFKSYIFADLVRDDPRVAAARDWIADNYTLEENPGIGMDGYYYYLVTFARGLHAWEEAEFETSDGTKRRWAEDFIHAVADRQREDGSFVNDGSGRWMESDPVLVTAYVVIALQHALD